RLLVADAYTVGTGPHASNDAKYKSVYQITPRRGYAANLPKEFNADGRIIFAGFRRILRDLLHKPITMSEIYDTDRFLATAHAGGTTYWFDRDLWVKVVHHCNGIVPVKIEAMLEGTTSFGYEPVVQITSAEGFGELAGYFESKLLHLWSSSERATSLKWAIDYLYRATKEAHPSWDKDQINFAVSIMIHDFGDRAGICAQESEVMGQAHLLIMPGTDTFAAGYLDWKENGETPHACSIHALAHRSVMAFMRENDCHAALYRLGKTTSITAHVSDTYNFLRQVDWFGEMLTTDWKEDENIIVARPDSGGLVKTVLHVLAVCEKYGLYTTDPDTGLKMATRLRWIQGDSVTWETMIEIIHAVLKAGWSPFASGAFGIGGWLRNSISRDHAGTSMKLCAVGNGDRPTVKKSEDVAKSSTPGVVKVIDNDRNADAATVYGINEEPTGENLLKVWFNGIRAPDLAHAFYSPALETSSVVRERISSDFLRRAEPKAVLSEHLRGLRMSLFDKNC
ncbi:MAG: hypothetical protein V3T23_04645, partial [Nitrososphaerales archaeon]